FTPAQQRLEPMAMTKPLKLHPDRLFPPDAAVRAIARRLYEPIAGLPIVSPHGHTDPAWFAENQPFANPAELLIVPDHYVFRMLYSQGVGLEDLGIPRADGGAVESDPRAIWRRFASLYHLFRGTPSRLWLDWVFAEVGGATSTDHGHPSAATADLPTTDAEALYAQVLSGSFTAAEAELFRAQMLTEMARMSIEDGMVMQLHPGVYRNHNRSVLERFGRDKGADIPAQTEFVRA